MNNKGITLIALVITIIVLLILAGVSIAMLTGNNGILTQASTAQKNTDKQNAIEKINVALQAIKTEVSSNLASDTTYNAVTAAKTVNTGLLASSVTGITSGEEGYVVTPTTDSSKIVKITYTNTSTGVKVEGSIDLTNVVGTTGGQITGAAVK